MKSKLQFKSRLWLSCAFLILSLIIRCIWISPEAPVAFLSVWDWVYAILEFVILILLLIYTVGQIVSAKRLYVLYFVAAGLWMVWWAVQSAQDIIDFSMTHWADTLYYVRDWLKIILYGLIFLCCAGQHSNFKAFRRVGNVLLLLEAILSIILCGVLVLFRGNVIEMLIDYGEPLFTVIAHACVMLFSPLDLLLLDLAMWLLLPTTLTHKVLASTSDVETCLLQLKADYENGYIGEREYQNLQTTLLNRI